MPITWQNINGPSVADAVRPLEIAQRGFNGAFDGLRDVLKESEAIDAANWQNTKVNNTNAALNQINQYATPEDYQAALKAGAVQQLLAAKGAQIDQQAVRAAADARLSVLQQRAKQNIEYNHAMTDERTQPLLDKFKAAELAGDKIGAAAAQAEYAKMGGRNLSDLAAFHDARQQLLVERGYAANKDSRETKMNDANITHLVNTDANNARNAATQEGLLKVQQSDESRKILEGLDKAYERAVLKNQTLKAMDSSTSAGQDEIGKFIKENVSKDLQDAAHNAAQQMIARGVPTAQIKTGLMGIGKSDWYDPFSWFDNGKANIARKEGVAAAGTANALTQGSEYQQSLKDSDAEVTRVKNMRQDFAQRLSAAATNATGLTVPNPVAEPPAAVKTLDKAAAKVNPTAVVTPPATPVATPGAPGFKVAQVESPLPAAIKAANVTPDMIKKIENADVITLRALRDQHDQEIKALNTGQRKTLSPEVAAYDLYAHSTGSTLSGAGNTLSGWGKSALDWLLEPEAPSRDELRRQAKAALAKK